MRLLLDAAYLLTAAVTAPVWVWPRSRAGKMRTDWQARLGRIQPLPSDGGRPRVLLHAVSVGEVNALRHLVQRLERAPLRPEIVVSATTDTGIARARTLFGDRHPVVRYPLDLSGAVDRFLDAILPDVVALVELEVWPNFVAACDRRRIPVCVINGRLSERSFRRYRLVRRLVEPSFQSLSAVAAQSEPYAERFRVLGADHETVSITGTMKWDAASLAPDLDRAERLAEEMGIDRDRPLVVAGSTAPGEHELLCKAVPYRAQLLCAPRRPEWFDQAAAVLGRCARRSAGDRGSPTGRFLLDTIGELQHAYALADVVVVGRSFGNLHGSDMMEPVALGKPTIVGPAVSDFQETVDVLLAAGGLVQVEAAALAAAIAELLDEPSRRSEIVDRARGAIAAQQGATKRHAELILSLLAAHVERELIAEGELAPEQASVS